MSENKSILQNIDWSGEKNPLPDAPDMSNFDGKALNDLRARVVKEDPTVTVDEMRKAVHFIFQLRGKLATEAAEKKKNEEAGKKVMKKETAKVDLKAKGNDLLGTLFKDLGV